MKPINQTVWQAGNTAERAGSFNRASGGRPTPTGRGPRDTPTYIRHDREARGPTHGRNRTSPWGPQMHRCTMESRRRRSESSFTATDCAGLEMDLTLYVFFLPSQIVEVERVMSSPILQITGWCVIVMFLSVYLLVSGVAFLKGFFQSTVIKIAHKESSQTR